MDTIVQNVIDRFKTRAEMGFQKYGTDLDRTDLTFQQWLNHAQEELHDGILYLEKIKAESQKQEVTDITRGTVNNILQNAIHNDVLNKVVISALNLMKVNPTLSIEEAMSDAYCLP